MSTYVTRPKRSFHLHEIVALSHLAADLAVRTQDGY